MRIFNQPKLFIAADYAREIVKTIDKAHSRVAVLATTLHSDDDLSKAIVDALCDAAKRGVIVSVCADSFTYIEPKGSVISGAKRHSIRAVNAMRVQHKLSKAGVNFHWLGRMSNISFAGRTHTKWTIVDDVVYSFGGVNLDRSSFTNNDFMLRISDSTLADRLYGEHLRIINADRAGHASHSRKLVINDETTVLVDGGIPFNSVIYRRACTLAREAKSIVFVSQYCPTGKLNRILKRKHATLYFNHWRQARWVNMIIIQLGMLTSRQSTTYNRRPYLHAKFIIFTMNDCSKVALTGSHNYTHSGVVMGTREIAMETTNTQIINQLELFFKKYVA